MHAHRRPGVWTALLVASVWACGPVWAAVGPGGGGDERGDERGKERGEARGGEAGGEGRDMKILDGEPKAVGVNGYSTSFHWPRILQRKLDRHFGGPRVVVVDTATKGGTPVARWIDVKTGKPLPPWEKVRAAIERNRGNPVVFLCQQSLQWAFGERQAGIRGADDAKRIREGADALERYARLLRKDGADLVFIAMHIYKHPMEPEIGNERHALAELVKRKVPGVRPGPDVWEPTKELYPKAFAGDGMHPNGIGAEVMAHLWFETLCRHDGIETPAWSREEMEKAIREGPAGGEGPKGEERRGRRRRGR